MGIKNVVVPVLPISKEQVRIPSRDVMFTTVVVQKYLFECKLDPLVRGPVHPSALRSVQCSALIGSAAVVHPSSVLP